MVYLVAEIDDPANADSWGLRPPPGGDFPWVAGNYAKGTVVSYNGGLWFAKAQTSQTPGAGPDWSTLLPGLFAQPGVWAPTTAYSATAPVSVVANAGSVYFCKTTHTSGASFDSSKWALMLTAPAGSLLSQGAWNAATNTPTLVSGVGTQGYFYRVSVAGTTEIDGVALWNVGDFIVFNNGRWDKWRGQTVNAEDIANATATGRAMMKATSAAAARLAAGIDGAVLVSDADQTMTADMSQVVWTGITAPRAGTLPALAGLNPGQALIIYDESGNCSVDAPISLNRTGADTVDGTTSVVLDTARAGVMLIKGSGGKFTSFRLGDRRALKKVTGGPYTFQAADHQRSVVRSLTTLTIDTLPLFGRDYAVRVKNDGTALWVIAPASGAIDGLTQLVLPPGAGGRIVGDGANYFFEGVNPQKQGRWLLSAQTAPGGAGVASLEDTSNLTAYFGSYEFEIEALTPAAANDTLIAEVYSGGAWQNSNYIGSGVVWQASSVAPVGPLTTAIQLTRASVPTSGMGVSGSLRLRNPSSTAAQKRIVFDIGAFTSVPQMEDNRGTYAWNSAGAITRLRFRFAGSNVVFGTMKLWATP